MTTVRPRADLPRSGTFSMPVDKMNMIMGKLSELTCRLSTSDRPQYLRARRGRRQAARRPRRALGRAIARENPRLGSIQESAHAVRDRIAYLNSGVDWHNTNKEATPLCCRSPRRHTSDIR